MNHFMIMVRVARTGPDQTSRKHVSTPRAPSALQSSITGSSIPRRGPEAPAGPPDYPQPSIVRLEYLYGLHAEVAADRNAGRRVRELRSRPDRRPDPGPAPRRGRADR